MSLQCSSSTNLEVLRLGFGVFAVWEMGRMHAEAQLYCFLLLWLAVGRRACAVLHAPTEGSGARGRGGGGEGGPVGKGVSGAGGASRARGQHD